MPPSGQRTGVVVGLRCAGHSNDAVKVHRGILHAAPTGTHASAIATVWMRIRCAVRSASALSLASMSTSFWLSCQS